MKNNTLAAKVFTKIYNQGPVKNLVVVSGNANVTYTIESVVDHDRAEVKYHLSIRGFKLLGVYDRLLFALEALEEKSPKALQQLIK